MRKLNEIAKIAEEIVGIRNVLKSVKNDEIENLRKQFIAAYPRLDEKPDQRILLDTLLDLLYDAKYVLRPQLQSLLNEGKIAQFGRTYGLLLKTIHEIGGQLVKMGMTYSSQGYIPTEERRTFDPKAVKALQNRVKQLAEDIKEGTTEEELPLLSMPTLTKKKKKETESGS